MERITKEEIEEIERMDERIYNLKEAILEKGPNQFVLGGYVNTIYRSSNDEKRIVRNRKNLQILNEKLVNESMERIKENTKKVLENV